MTSHRRRTAAPARGRRRPRHPRRHRRGRRRRRPARPAGAAGAVAARPEAKGDRPVATTIGVSGTYDGKLKRFHDTGELGSDGQDESRKPGFVLKDGAVLKNVILGTPAADGVHRLGGRTLRNVWWENVGEDAATSKGTSAASVYAVHGGGARSASGKEPEETGTGPDGTTCRHAAGYLSYD
ncbi:hypothetical protein GCM10010275_21000 [Streptomyces litmocidini]|uniref:pectate lyase n=1 Tax=Streptomyces litmocidini TaxID=67318 RepID=UPI0019969835|nr:pectate lyase [Streptomyces litmocidini]GGU85463.1 hypothetical protein GCM10010275_21000 [Streptomyces litmocidini]